MKHFALSGVVLLSILASHASAYELRCRFVERVGNIDFVLTDNTIFATPDQVRNIRIQFGVFDDSTSAAPQGGFAGWRAGTLAVSGIASNSDERRNPGRLEPFAFSQAAGANGNPPLPNGDPFDSLTDIESTLGTQIFVWTCNPDGTVPPQPSPVVRGLNTFVSVFAFSLSHTAATTDYTITASGDLYAATEWRQVGSHQHPDCGNPADPSDDIPATVVYAPFPTPAQPFTSVLAVRVPTGGSALAFAFGCLAVHRRRRISISK